jgi:hypothetical protein
MHRTRSVLMASVILVLGFSSFAVARTGDPLREGARNGTATQETRIIARIDATTANTGGYSTRQSNLSRTGGGAIYGCRSTGAANANPCVRANNLATGLAFQFNAASAPVAGQITAGTGGDGKKPFTTNATGVADGLNADRVDGASASQLRTRWALVNEAGQIESQSGGFTVLDGYQTNQNVYLDAGESLVDNGIAATIAIRNVGDGQNAGGEISASRCQVDGVVDCAPASAKNVNAFVVSPRNSDGTATTSTTRKRFYVTITE